MSGQDTSLQAITGPGVVAILRADGSSFYPHAAAALVSGGIRAIEVTLTTPGAIMAITRVASDVPEAIVVASGSVTATSRSIAS